MKHEQSLTYMTAFFLQKKEISAFERESLALPNARPGFQRPAQPVSLGSDTYKLLFLNETKYSYEEGIG